MNRDKIKEAALVFITLLGLVCPVIAVALLPFLVGFLVSVALEILFIILLTLLDDGFFLTNGVSYIVSILIFWGTIGYTLMHILPQVMLKLFDFIQKLF